jgi:hypothetical protein
VNRGRPEIAATPKPGAFNERGVVHAKAAGGNYNPPANRGGAQAENRSENNNPSSRTTGGAGTSTFGHVRDLPPAARPTSSGDPKQDRAQEKLYAQQQKERDKMAQQQQKEDNRIAKQNNEQARSQMEQRHQQQTQQLQEKHLQQQQQMQQRMAPRSPGRRPAH